MEATGYGRMFRNEGIRTVPSEDEDKSARPDQEQAAMDSPTAAPHPEEMRGTVTCRIGNFASMTATGRATPAGLISAALLVCAILVPTLALLRRRKS
ncbi:MAG: hypothetical protein AB7F35_06635 [Acetobacteraceae bacterium]